LRSPGLLGIRSIKKERERERERERRNKPTNTFVGKIRAGKGVFIFSLKIL